jgi:hypothetical protein
MALEEIDITASGRLSATTMSADTVFVGGNQLTLSSAHLPILTADTFYGNTIYSGGTDLYDIFITSAETGVQNLIDVGKSGNVAFNSIKAAVDSITGNSSTNRYVIRVAPGKYIEDTIYMKPYVELWGYANFATIIESDATSKNVVVLTGATSLNNFILQGSTDTGKAALSVEGSFGPGVICEVNNCTFGSTHTIFKSNLSAGTYAIVGMTNTNSTSFTNFSVGFDIGGSGTTLLSVTNSKSVIRCAVEDFIRISGSTNRTIFTDTGVLVISSLGGSMQKLLKISSGARADFSNSSVDGINTAIYSENVGAGPTIRCSSMNILNSVNKDIDIQNSGTSGFFEGTMVLEKVSIATGSTFYLFGHDSSIINVA